VRFHNFVVELVTLLFHSYYIFKCKIITFIQCLNNSLCRLSNLNAPVENVRRIMKHFLCSQTHRQHNALFFIFSLMAVIWSDCVFYSESLIQNSWLNELKNYILWDQTVVQTTSLNAVPPRPFTAALPHCYSTDRITQQCCTVLSSYTTLCTCRIKVLTQNCCSSVFLLLTLSSTHYYEQKTRWLLSLTFSV